MPDINNKIAYIIAVVNEFSTRFSLNSQQAQQRTCPLSPVEVNSF